MRKRFLILILIISSCSSLKGYKCNFSGTCFTAFMENDSNLFQKFSQDSKRILSLEDYKIYVLSLCEDSSFMIKEGQIEDLPYPVIESCENKGARKILEQNYLLIPQDENDKKVIYITSFSHKYLDSNCGVFNCPTFQDKFFIEDIDYIYLGEREGDQITFSSGKKDKSVWIIETEEDSIKLKTISLPTRGESPRRRILLNDVFASEIVFYLKEMELQYGKSAYEECYSSSTNSDCSISLPDQSVGGNLKASVKKIFLSNKHLYFQSQKGDTIEYYRFNKKKIKS